MSNVKLAPHKFIVSILFIAFLIYGVITIASQSGDAAEAERRLAELKTQQTYEQKRSLELDEELSKVGSDEFVEAKAKEYGYVKSNEVIYIDKAAQ